MGSTTEARARTTELADDLDGEEEGVLPYNRAFVLLRYTLIISTAYLLLVEGRFAVPSSGILLVLAAALASNVFISVRGQRLVGNSLFTAIVTVADTIWITTCLVWSRHFNAEFFYLYFFVILLAATGGSLKLVALGAVVVCAGYLSGVSATGGVWSLWASPSLIRLPFLFTVAAFSGYLVDRTRHEIQRSRELENENRTKSDFLAVVSHELRTPLNAIMGYAEMALDEELDAPSRQEAVQGIDRASRSLLNVVENTLALKRFQEGRDNVHLEQLSFAAIWEELRLTCSPLALSGKVALQWSSSVPDQSVLTDRGKLTTIVRNLVSNALKFTEKGSVAVSADCDATGLRLRVADTGIGISEEDRNRIFEPFLQANSPQRSRGTGLGLYIVRHFTEQLGGRVTLDSEPGQGSVFTVTLPPIEAAAMA